MRSLIHSLAVLAVILSGITAGDLRALAGIPASPVEANALQSNDAPSEAAPCCGDSASDSDMNRPMAADNDTSECHTTSAYLAASHVSVQGPMVAPCFDTHIEHAVGTSLAPTGPPPKLAA